MIVRLRTQPLRAILRWTRRALYCAGFSLLACGGFILLDARVFQERENRLLDGQLSVRTSLSVPGVPVAVTAGDPIGRIEIPRLGLSEIIIEGSNAKTLRRAVGHIQGTALPGQSGNTVITGHRDTFFRPLRKIQRNEFITLTTLQGEYVYRVVSTSVVSPNDVGVLDSTGDEELTLITCYPFYFVGAAPQRFVVHAERVARPGAR